MESGHWDAHLEHAHKIKGSGGSLSTLGNFNNNYYEYHKSNACILRLISHVNRFERSHNLYKVPLICRLKKLWKANSY